MLFCYERPITFRAYKHTPQVVIYKQDKAYGTGWTPHDEAQLLFILV